MEYKPGLQIGRYVLKECLDTGGEAQVWKAFQGGLPVAIKLRTAARLKEREEVTRQDEAYSNEKEQWIEFTRSSVHIVNILDVFSGVIDDDDGVAWVVHAIVSEFSALGDLQRAIESGALKEYLPTEAQFIQFLLHIISGVKAGHDEGRFHCDIKPKNVLLFRDGGGVVPKLTDFGIAGTALEPIKGLTPGYSAPELKPGVGPTAQSDVYSLAITFYDILYATIFHSGAQVKTARHYKSGRAYKEYLKELTQDETRVKHRVPYADLIESMAIENAADRASLDQIKSLLESSLVQVLSAGPQYAVRTKVDTFLWHPAVHDVLQEKLYYVLVKGGNPTLDLQDIIADLNHAGFTGFSLRSVIGGWDYVVRIWLPKSPQALGSATRAIARNGRSLKVLEVTSAHFTTERPKRGQKTPDQRDESDIQMLRVIEELSGAPDKLQLQGYIVNHLNHDPKCFRVTLLVSIDRGFGNLAPVVGAMVKEKILETDRKAKEISYYDVKPIDDVDVRLVVKFMHTSFIECRKTLLTVFSALVQHGDHFKFSTLLDVNADQDCLSDDGSIIARIKAAHSGGL